MIFAERLESAGSLPNAPQSSNAAFPGCCIADLQVGSRVNTANSSFANQPGVAVSAGVRVQPTGPPTALTRIPGAGLLEVRRVETLRYSRLESLRYGNAAFPGGSKTCVTHVQHETRSESRGRIWYRIAYFLLRVVLRTYPRSDQTSSPAGNCPRSGHITA